MNGVQPQGARRLTDCGSARRPGIHAGGEAGSVGVAGRTRAGYNPTKYIRSMWHGQYYPCHF